MCPLSLLQNRSDSSQRILPGMSTVNQQSCPALLVPRAAVAPVKDPVLFRQGLQAARPEHRASSVVASHLANGKAQCTLLRAASRFRADPRAAMTRPPTMKRSLASPRDFSNPTIFSTCSWLVQLRWVPPQGLMSTPSISISRKRSCTHHVDCWTCQNSRSCCKSVLLPLTAISSFPDPA